MRNLSSRWGGSCLRLLLGLGVAAIPVLTLAQTATPPTVSQISFTPATIQSGGASRLTITLGNANAVPAALTQALTDTLPAGMAIANPAAAGGSCPAGALATAGGRAVSYAAGSTIPAGGCTIQVNTTGTSTARNTYFTDSIAAGALQTTLGSNPAAASGTLTVQAGAVVPNVVGLTQAAAASALQAAGLTLGTVSKAPGPASIPYNSVFSQVPAAGAAAQAGSAVNVSISTGAGLATNPNRPLTSVPNYVAPYQQSEAAALERVCASLQSTDPSSLKAAQRNLLANCNAVMGTYGGGLDAAGLKQTLSAISGKQTTAQQRTGVQFAGAQFTNIGARLAQLRQGASGASFSGLDLGLPAGNALGTLFAALEDASGNDSASRDNSASRDTERGSRGGGASADPDSISALTRLGFFINGSLRRGSQDTTTYETPFDFKSNSITAGVDYRFTNRIILGLALGHSNGSTQFSDGSGRLDSHSNSVSLYGTYYDEAFYVDLKGTLGHISYNAARNTVFSINPNVSDIPTNCSSSECSINTTGATSARQYAFSTNVGYSFNQGGLTYGPDVALDYTRVHVNAFSESDPYQSGLAMVFGEDTGESLLAKAGGHVAYAIKTSYAVILPAARAHYVHEFKNDQRALSVHFGSDPAANTPSGPISNFVVFTDPPNRGYFDWAAGFSAQFAFGISAFVDYNSISSANQRMHEFTLGLRIEHQVL
jgi:outer membrane lipase/esterase